MSTFLLITIFLILCLFIVAFWRSKFIKMPTQSKILTAVDMTAVACFCLLPSSIAFYWLTLYKPAILTRSSGDVAVIFFSVALCLYAVNLVMGVLASFVNITRTE